MARGKGTVSAAVKEKLEEGWESLSAGTIIKWEKGKQIEGHFIEIRKAGKGSVLDINDKDEGIITVGCPTFLQTALRHVEDNDYIRIKCTGKVNTPNGLAWTFDVARKKA